MSYFVKLTDEDLSRYSNKIESVGLRKVPDRRSDCKCCKLQNVYISLPQPHIMAAGTAGINRMKKLRHCQRMYSTKEKFDQFIVCGI